MKSSQTQNPKQAYLDLLSKLYEEFQQSKTDNKRPGRPSVYSTKALIIFFTVMMVRRKCQFKTQYHWLEMHEDEAKQFGFKEIPHRSTLSRRYKSLSKELENFIQFIGHWAENIPGDDFQSKTLYEDASLFTSHGAKWHKVNRDKNEIPNGVRNIDEDSTWRKSGYHGWVQGFSLHLTCNHKGFPKICRVETGSFHESQMMEEKEADIFSYKPKLVIGDNGYHQATRVRRWENCGVHLITPAEKWQNGRYAQKYHEFIQEDWVAIPLARRKTVIEPMFDIISKLVGTNNNHKQLPIRKLINIRTLLLLATVSLQIIMIVNVETGIPIKTISNFIAAFG
jgi:hypothetical protein